MIVYGWGSRTNGRALGGGGGQGRLGGDSSPAHALCGPLSAQRGARIAPSTGVLDRASLCCLERGTEREGGVTGLKHAAPQRWVVAENERSFVDLETMQRHLCGHPREMRRTALRAAEPARALLPLQLWRTVL